MRLELCVILIRSRRISVQGIAMRSCTFSLPAALLVAAGLSLPTATSAAQPSPNPSHGPQSAAASPTELSELAARVLSPRVRRLNKQLNAIRGELVNCPPLSVGHQRLRLGCHSVYHRRPDRRVDVVLDLGHVRQIDAIAMIPVHLALGSSVVAGYGFPARSRVELAKTKDFRMPEVVVDYSGVDCPSPGDYPLYRAFEPRECRYVRLTVLKLWACDPNLWIFSLAELMVLSGNRNVAIGQPVRSTSSVETAITWSAANLVDGQSSLGLPVSNAKSPTNGYSSEFSPEPETVKWVQVDLGRKLPIDEVRLIPSQPVDWPNQHGFGFPARFRLEVSSDAEPAVWVPILDATAEDFTNPGDNAVTIPAHGQIARHVRLTATRLYTRAAPGSPNACLLALAELQVYSRGRNVALSSSVISLDSFHYQLRPFWSRQFLVDGYSSQNELIELPHWLAGLDRRRELESRYAVLVGQRETSVRDVLSRATMLSSFSALLIVSVAVLFLLRTRRQRRRELRQIRSQIARDLHDDIGSSIGSIRLLSELAQDAGPLPEDAKQDLAEIHRIAGTTTEAIRDMVWLIDSEQQPKDDLVQRLRRTCDSMLGDLEVTFEVEGASRSEIVDVNTHRHVLFAFKEALNNVVRHAAANRVRVKIECGRRHFRFIVRDDGCGFDPRHASKGNGLRNLRRRAESVQGSVVVESIAGQGTTVRFEARTP